MGEVAGKKSTLLKPVAAIQTFLKAKLSLYKKKKIKVWFLTDYFYIVIRLLRWVFKGSSGRNAVLADSKGLAKKLF